MHNTTPSQAQILWFKHDLSLHDHPALSSAAAAGPVLPLYIIEPSLWRGADASARHYAFLIESLHDLRASLAKRGLTLTLRVGEAVSVLADVVSITGAKALWSHQETWNMASFQRDKAVAAWARSTGLQWHQPRRIGVLRGPKSRDDWADAWQMFMQSPLAKPPDQITGLSAPSDPIPRPNQLGLMEDPCPGRQRGGRRAAIQILDAFLHNRSRAYRFGMSSPVTAFDSCARLSPHLAFGTLSMREVLQATQRRQIALRSDGDTNWDKSLSSFISRLHWHCHFIQKLEDDPRIEFQNMHPAYDRLRQDTDATRLAAWAEGRTGFPLIDATMRALIHTGWMNFRMRAMLVSFASNHLWLPWQSTAPHLARLFTDYEPGIHYPQMQMQSGTTGMNTLRIYNPIKQSMDQDPHGRFIRQWVPELRDMPLGAIHTPWKLPEAMNGYPMPMVDEAAARKAAQERLYGLRKTKAHKAPMGALIDKHASRKKPPRRRRVAAPKKPDQGQGVLDL
jgi:deoxyribodipyrimidine photo-lyase